jgi:hypothetical protein
MRQTATDTKRDVTLRILTTAMAILRDDQFFDPTQVIFGRNFATRPVLGSAGNEYSFENSILPATQITLQTKADCVAHIEKIRVAPSAFTIWFSPLVTEITRSTLEDLLQLGVGYWIDRNGKRQPGNDMGTVPPHIRVHNYRYRALAQPTSRFPVNVEFTFIDPDASAATDEGPAMPALMMVRLKRDGFKTAPRLCD